MRPALIIGKMGNKNDSHSGSLGNSPISREAEAGILRRLLPRPGMIKSSSTGNGLKWGLGARVNMWMERPTIINMGRASKKTSSVHIISHTIGNFTCKMQNFLMSNYNLRYFQVVHSFPFLSPLQNASFRHVGVSATCASVREIISQKLLMSFARCFCTGY